MDFVTSHFGKRNLWPVERFFNIFVITLGWVCWVQSQVMTNMLKKMFNWSEVHLSEMTCYKIHTLENFGNKIPIFFRISLNKPCLSTFHFSRPYHCYILQWICFLLDIQNCPRGHASIEPGPSCFEPRKCMHHNWEVFGHNHKYSDFQHNLATHRHLENKRSSKLKSI